MFVGRVLSLDSCPANECPGGVTGRGNCYRLFNLKMNWTEAQTFCQTYNLQGLSGGRLGSLYSSTHQTVLRSHLSTAGGLGQPLAADVWISGRLQNPMNMTGLAQRMWRWVSGNYIYYPKYLILGIYITVCLFSIHDYYILVSQ